MKTILLILLPILLTGQSILYEEGQSGLIGQVQITSGGLSTLYAAMGSYVFNGQGQVGVGVGRESILGVDIISKMIFGDYVALRETEDMPINLSINGHYQISSIEDFSLSLIRVQLEASHIFDFEDSEIRMVPLFLISHSRIKADFGDLFDLSYAETVMAIGGTFQIKKFFIKTGFAINSDNQPTTILLGYLF